jgi:hypothetical protein
MESSPTSRPRLPAASAPGGGAVYGLGLIGAIVYFWQLANTFWQHILALLKAFVWPALIVYDAFRTMRG